MVIEILIGERGGKFFKFDKVRNATNSSVGLVFVKTVSDFDSDSRLTMNLFSETSIRTSDFQNWNFFNLSNWHLQNGMVRVLTKVQTEATRE